MPGKRIFEIILLGAFSAVCLAGILHHEIWLDEAHHWLLARDSNTIAELFKNARYEGHPLLWNVILFIITRFTFDVTSMQITHLMISILAVSLFLFYAPFRLREKFMFVFGYFILYEYTLLSRNYSLLLLFLFLSVILLKKRKYLALGISLALLANTHLFGLFIASCFVLMVGIELWIEQKEIVDKKLVTGFLIFLTGVVISLWQIVPPLDSTLYTYGQRSGALERLGRTSVVFVKSFIPLPDVTNYRFWNTNLLMAVSKPLCVLLSLFLLIIPVVYFRKRLQVICFYYGNAMLMLLFFYLTDFAAVRYFGMLYVLFVVSLWLSSFTTHWEVRALHRRFEVRFKQDYSKQFFRIILGIQLLAGVVAYALEWSRPFSESKHVSAYLKREMSSARIIAWGCGAAPVSSYLGKKIYYLAQQGYGSFCFFNRSLGSEIVTDEELKNKAMAFKRSTDHMVVLITHQPLLLSETEIKQFHMTARFTQSILRNENYYVYRVGGL